MITRRKLLGAAAGAPAILAQRSARRPNILFAISDDQSFAHTGAMGDRVVKTPAFDEVAQRGILFTNAVSNSPGCAPSRAALLTGRPHWQLEEAGTHASHFPTKFEVYPALLQKAGYHVGLTGKGAGPANFEGSGWKHNPAGPDYRRLRLDRAPQGMSPLDYAANFEDFLNAKGKDQPFCFWFGGQEPHRVFEPGAGKRAGKRIEDVKVPVFLPDTPEVRSDILDYYAEIEHFDSHLNRMLRALEQRGELDNTLILVTSDNGMAFPGSKATMREYGIHLPLAVAWTGRAKGGRRVSEMVSFLDYAPTFLEAAGVSVPEVMGGRSLLRALDGGSTGRNAAFSGRERHSHSRFDNLGYPARAMRTEQHLYIRNFAPDRWPAGDPPIFADIDDSPSKRYLLENRENPDVRRYFEISCGKRPAEELYDIVKDPGCIRNLADSPAHAATRKRMREELDRTLSTTGDPRMSGNGDIWESYPRFSPMRPQLGGFAEQGQYNPKYGK
jgi:uncharacterized sulfatase